MQYLFRCDHILYTIVAVSGKQSLEKSFLENSEGVSTSGSDNVNRETFTVGLGWFGFFIVLLWFQNVSCRSVSVGFAEKTSVFGLGFHDKRIVNFFMNGVIWHDFHHR